jgi:catechol 2,3-dioxygenase-like lactoylglutathione lyase family enzyme
MKLTFVRLLVNDYPACFRFYRDAMGFPVTFGDEEGGYADFDAGSDVSLALFVRPDDNLLELNHALEAA